MTPSNSPAAPAGSPHAASRFAQFYALTKPRVVQL
ncbi:MAG: protoheme IX farnesyltransferase, partial [Polaromonas sp.]